MQQPIIIIMGVSGVGKTTIGKLLSLKSTVPFFDGDDFHPTANKQKMEAGNPLNDDDRHGWLLALNQLASTEQKTKGAIIACSALKEKYRIQLSQNIENIYFLHLKGDFQLILDRMQQRKGHFMPAQLLQSQFETLETPSNAIVFDVKMSPEEIVSNANDILFNKTEFGLIGLGVMGKSLSRNLAGHGFSISIYNRHLDEKEVDIARNFKNEFSIFKNSQAFDQLSNFVISMARPRKVMLMVNAGKTVDIVIKDLLPFLDEGDIIIDGGNSHYEDTKRRTDELKSRNIHFFGVGVSGGEEGALEGPSIMPGGSEKAYLQVSKYLETIAATDVNGKPCCTYIGPEGSGHYIKMVHNGIEYAEMQLLAEVYQLLRLQLKTPTEIADLLASWRNTELDSFLLEITIDILRKKEGDSWLIDHILDKAGNKGTGNWTTISTAQLGIPSTMISSSLFARYISSFKKTREKAAHLFSDGRSTIPKFEIKTLQEAYTVARIVNHHQGFLLIKQASNTFNWNLNLSEIARIWTNGCIIRSTLMESLIPELKSAEEELLFKTEIINLIKKLKPSLKEIVISSIESDIAIPCISEALTYMNGISTANSSANMIQAQRDYFGAHTYQRNDKEGTFHTNWKNN